MKFANTILRLLLPRLGFHPGAAEEARRRLPAIRSNQ
jgi:hypothetical protein